jgi:hypothetical protein
MDLICSFSACPSRFPVFSIQQVTLRLQLQVLLLFTDNTDNIGDLRRKRGLQLCSEEGRTREET